MSDAKSITDDEHWMDDHSGEPGAEGLALTVDDNPVGYVCIYDGMVYGKLEAFDVPSHMTDRKEIRAYAITGVKQQLRAMLDDLELLESEP